MEKVTAEQMHEKGHFMLQISVGLLGAITTLLISYFIWSSNTLVAVRENIGVLSSKMETYTKTLEIYAENQYTKQEASSDRKLVEFELNALKQRVTKLEDVRIR